MLITTNYAFYISVAALFISVIALNITFRKEAHRVRLELTPTSQNGLVLGIINDGGIDTNVRSISFFKHTSNLKWITDKVGDNATNKEIPLPILVKARSTYEVYLGPRTIKHNSPATLNFCVQLDTGRLFVLTPNLTFGQLYFMHFVSLISRITAGRYSLGVERPRTKVW